MFAFDISAIVVLHNEGILAHPSLHSVARAKAFAEGLGRRVEMIVALDNPSDETLAYLDGCGLSDFITVRVSYGDLGQVRNAAARAARGEWIAFLDGDDLWAENWLAAAHDAGRAETRRIVLHPAVNIFFGIDPYLFVHVDMDDEDFDILKLAMINYWTALSFAKRELYLEFPFPAADLKRQIGYEDWSWNMQTIAGGCHHKSVRDTVHAIRQKRNSLVVQTTSSQAMPVANDLFRTLLSRRRGGDAIAKPTV